MIGLKRGVVKLASHDKEWALEFEKERTRLQENLGDRVIDIQHIGSTAVPKLCAKPIIDISIGIRRLKDANKLTRIMNLLGYRFHKKSAQEIFFAKGPDARRTHYVHVMRYKGAKWMTDMLFRDYLLTHVRHTIQYGHLKEKLAKKYPTDKESYTGGKNSFIKMTLQLATNHAA